MRLIGRLPSAEQARVFEDYALFIGIEINTEADGDEWAIWALDEDRLEDAKRELRAFQESPDDAKYRDAREAAEGIRDQQFEEIKKARKLNVDVRQNWSRPQPVSAPVTMLMLLCIALVAAGSQLGEKTKPFLNNLGFQNFDDYRRGAVEPLEEIKSGEVWRAVTPMFIHFGVLHTVFNSYMFFQFGLMVEFRRGSLRFLLMVLLLSAAANFAQFLVSGPFFGGMSGVLYGLFGYCWMKSRFDPGSGFFLDSTIIIWLMGWFFLCMAGVMDTAGSKVANTAHAAGLIVGMCMGYAPKLMRDLQQR